MNRFMSSMSDGGSIQAPLGSVLSDEQIRSAVPSAFAAAAHRSRSERFAPIPTSHVIGALRHQGFMPVFAQQTRARTIDRRQFTRHMLRFRHPDMAAQGGAVPELILTNANDGTSAYNLRSGAFVFLCMNGLMTGDTYAMQRVRHSGNASTVAEKVIEGAFEVIEQSEKVRQHIGTMKEIVLDRDEQLIYAEAAHSIRFNDPEKAPIDPHRLLEARRPEDMGNDLWRVYNRTQENAKRGGQHGMTTNANGVRRPTKTRAVNSIDKANKLDRALWTLAEKMAELKAG